MSGLAQELSLAPVPPAGPSRLQGEAALWAPGRLPGKRLPRDAESSHLLWRVAAPNSSSRSLGIRTDLSRGSKAAGRLEAKASALL